MKEKKEIVCVKKIQINLTLVVQKIKILFEIFMNHSIFI